MTENIGRFSYRHRWLGLLAWVAVMVAGGLSAGTVFERMADSDQLAGTETAVARQVLSEGTDRSGTVIALWNGEPDMAAVDRVRAELIAIPGVKQVDKPLPALDGKGVALQVVIAKVDKPAQKAAVQAVEKRLRELSPNVRLGGSKIIGPEINEAVQADLSRAEFSSLPVTVLIMIFVFGGIIAAGLPLLATLATVAGSFAVLFGFSQFVDLDSNIISVVSMLGLALCIDYSLLLVARYREELAAGHTGIEAVGRTWATAGRTIMFSALIVAAALSGLLLFEVPRLQAMGAAGISATIVALLSALTLTSALLAFFGRKIKPARQIVPGGAARHLVYKIRTRRRRATCQERSDGPVQAASHTGETGFFAGLARITQKRPLLFAVGTAAVLIAAGSPLIGATVKLPDLDGLPRSIESVQVLDDLQNRYGQTANPAVTVVARADPATLDAWAARWAGDAAVSKVDRAVQAGPNLSTVSLVVPGDGQSAQARDLVVRLRADRPAGVESWVMGDAAMLSDLRSKLADGLPYALGLTVLAVFVLLFLMTGSLVVPIKALLMNFISLGATFGVLIAVFEHGWLAGPLDTLTVGGLSPFVMVLVFAFGFGLSMDYEVFLLGRIKEYVDAGFSTDEAVRKGLQRSGRLITSAALLMLIVFGFFAAAEVGDLEQIGLGLFVAILVDATIVRCLLVPATMTLLGRWNWWAPAPLRRVYARYGLVHA